MGGGGVDTACAGGLATDVVGGGAAGGGVLGGVAGGVGVGAEGAGRSGRGGVEAGFGRETTGADVASRGRGTGRRVVRTSRTAMGFLTGRRPRGWILTTGGSAGAGVTARGVATAPASGDVDSNEARQR